MNKQSEDTLVAWALMMFEEREAARLDYFKSPLEMYKFFISELTGSDQTRLLGFRLPRTLEEIKARALEIMAVLDAADADDMEARECKNELAIIYYNATLELFGHGMELEGFEGVGADEEEDETEP